ncbi:hypothetical protein [Zoogloea sp.]|uniref:hypothetical protein n=1 Tax=Zoogloea sp. TaxID=49181 RepID=UPI0026387D42|nr:hypothetical protein [Zoogloea sp.]MDD3353332.1 hypothetical protein [Zoogloea sp.]
MPLPWSSYLRWMLGSLLGVLCLTGSINALIDPLDVTGSPTIRGINALKPYLDHHRELARWQRAQRLCANTGILGNSRAEIGFDPLHPAFQGVGLSAFNHAIPGSRLHTSLQQLYWLEDIGCLPGTLIIGLDFFNFLGGTSLQEVPLPRPGPPPAIGLPFLAENILSISGLGDALRTLRIQHTRNPGILTERGFNPLLPYIDEVAHAGHSPLFRQRAEENLGLWTAKPPRLAPAEGGPSSDLLALEAILDLAQSKGSTVHLVIYPYHAQIRGMMEKIGLTPLFLEWKRQMNTLASRRQPGQAPLALWDFSTLSEETREAIPPPGDRTTRLHYYWEAGHFKKELGDKILERILLNQGEFGVRLDTASIEHHLAEDQRSVTRLVATPSPLMTDIEDILSRHKKH